jgi:hypothetical protein
MTHRVAFARRDLVALLALGLVGCGLFNPATQKVREAAARAESNNHLHQMGIGLLSMSDQYQGKWPPCTGAFLGKNGTLFFHLLPFVEWDEVYKSIPPGGTSNNPGLFQSFPIATYRAPLDESNDGKSSLISYASNRSLFLPGGEVVAPGAPEMGGARFPGGLIAKGTSNQITLVERYSRGSNRWWDNSSPDNTSIEGAVCNAGGAGQPISVQFGVAPAAADNRVAHAFASSVCLVALGDGSTKSLSQDINAPFGPAGRTLFNWACDPSSVLAPPAQW